MTAELIPARRFHAVNNALQVVTGATSALVLYDSDLTARDKAQLEDAITKATRELEELLDLDESGSGDGATPAVALAIADARSRDADIVLDAADVPFVRGDGPELATLLAEIFVATCAGAGGIVRPSIHDDHVAIDIFVRYEGGSERRFDLRLRRA